MKKKVIYIIILIAFLTVPDYAISYAYDNAVEKVMCQLSDSYKKVKENFTVVIDAGHGGKDPGTMGKNSKEKNIALSIALLTGERIKSLYPDVNIIYTRDDDTFIPLFQRIKMANAANADLFISIHCNASGRSSASGTETYVMGLHRAKENLEVAKRENSAILLENEYQNNYDGFDPNSDAGHIILSMYQNLYLDQSIEFANLVENNLGVRTSRGVKQAGFVVLRQATMPAILIETGFLSNRQDEAKLLSKKGQQRIAQSIAHAFGKYKTMKRKQDKRKQENEKVANKEAVPDATTQYTVQIAATSQKKENAFLKVPSLYHKQVGKLHKYYSGTYANVENAKKAKDKLIKMGYKGAFIVTLDPEDMSFVQKAK